MALLIGATGAAALASAVFLELSVVARLALSVMTVAATVVGLSSESLRLDFQKGRLRYEERFAGRITKKIDDDFRNVEAVSVLGISGEPAVRTARPLPTPTAWNVVLNYAGKPQQAMLVGTFTDREKAVREAQRLSERMKIPTQVIS
jgi:hypothetical protein